MYQEQNKIDKQEEANKLKKLQAKQDKNFNNLFKKSRKMRSYIM
jgi:hypothetical protein